MKLLAALATLTAAFCTSAPASPQLINKYGIDFAVIGDPGNRATNSSETPFNSPRGSVGHTYALSRTEISIGQWYEFVDAYGKYVSPTLAGPTFLGRRGIGLDFSRPSGFGLLPEAKAWAAEVGWRYAAMYCNWLHNGRVNDKWAFESGAYDVSTFGKVGNVYTDQVTRSQGAKFWIPSLDEWIKAAYWDPNRNGPGQGGYWLRPGGQDTLLTPGLPENGGQSSAATSNAKNLPVGSYPNVFSPWGLLDTSGSVAEWTERANGLGQRTYYGTGAGDSMTFNDSPDWVGSYGLPDFNLYGIRLATVVPSPGTATTLVTLPLLSRRRRK